MNKRFYPSSGKRLFDLAVSFFLLVVSAPILGCISIAVRLSLGSPIFFRQLRAGQFGKPFKIIKFRTMLNICDENGILLPDHRRLTNFGKFLRSASLDELPEIWNVIRGDMSIVGPRPLPIRYLPRYSPFEGRRHEVKPGITGWAQVHGRNDTSWSTRFKLDLYYVDNLSLGLDLKILLLTTKKVISREGVSQPGHATMEEFRGTSNE